MAIRLWTLILLSPFLLYAIYLILEEGRDPLTRFHDDFRAEYFGDASGGKGSISNPTSYPVGHSRNISRMKTRSDLDSSLPLLSKSSKTSIASSTSNSSNSSKGSKGSKIAWLSPESLKAGRIATGKFSGIRVRDLFVSIVASILVLAIALGVPPSLLILLGLLGISLYMWKEREGGRSAAKERDEQEAEFPAIVEMLTILVAAGESPSLALVHIAERSTGSLSKNLKAIASELKGGRGLIGAIDAAGKDSKSTSFKRFCDSLIVAVERGTPIVGVLQNQVVESRDVERNRLIKASGRSEIALMIPIVFLILPISILFALWPSYVTLGASMHG